MSDPIMAGVYGLAGLALAWLAFDLTRSFAAKRANRRNGVWWLR